MAKRNYTPPTNWVGAYKARTARPARPKVTRAVDAASQEPARAEANRRMTYDTALALQEAKLGDDTFLLPYQPTPSINPPRPRTMAAGYDRSTQTLRIRFRDGAVYAYNEVTPREWQNFKRVKSPGRFINRVLNQKEYYREAWE
jgi:hypothetical protein